MPSLVLHAALLGYGAWRKAHPASVPPPPVADVSALEVEVLELLEPAPSEATEEEPRAELASAVPTPRAAVAARATAAPLASQSGETAEPLGPTEEPGEALAEPAAGAVVTAPSAAPPGLSLAQLGVGPQIQFVRPADPASARAEKAARVKRRLDRALAQGLMNQDTASGRGAGSPVLRALEAAVYSSTAPLNGGASFVFVIDSSGKVVSSALGEASGDRERWVRVARQAAQALAQKTLSVPKGKSVRLTVAVSSHLEMPSGADPGVAVDVFGLPVKRGEGPRSAKVDVLNPLKPLAPLSMLGDPADIGAKARRMVHARVVGEELL